MLCSMNRNFVASIIGALQMAIIVIGLLTISLLGFAMTVTGKDGDYLICGFSFYGFLFIVCFWCLMTSLVVVISCATSQDTANNLHKTTFFIFYHAAAAVFYLIGSLAALGAANKYTYIVGYTTQSNIRSVIYVAGSTGVIETVLYALVTFFGVAKYREA